MEKSEATWANQQECTQSKAGHEISGSILNHTHTNGFITDIITCPWQLY